MKDIGWIGNNMRVMTHAMHRLAIYDMDKTITKGATWTPFLATYARRRWWDVLPLIATLGPAGLYLAKRIDRARLKEMTQALVVGRRAKLATVATAAERFGKRVAAKKVRVDARARIAADQAAGYRVVLATASYDFYVRPIAAALGIADVIATPSTVDGDRLIARIAGENCYADAKLRMIEAWMAGEGIARADAHVRFYSDHVSDAPTLDWADEAFAVNPHVQLRDMALAKGWPILDWR
ncbi:HAD-IB family hydrolase [Sphingomonas sp.]|jgi:HAD superfamily hydrolase (TIGR01490 family)|uniref:HAD family hydrolase n=1 Tax=Sphingomonas sp. TaxID=28214 RepID=UPI002E3760A9|nr:HAD-IB family hydrolase [Sphingomonas sp.]HEX4695637.1 HAD-IB family hydrolase [Sphingomonas sp.]